MKFPSLELEIYKKKFWENYIVNAHKLKPDSTALYNTHSLLCVTLVLGCDRVIFDLFVVKLAG